MNKNTRQVSGSSRTNRKKTHLPLHSKFCHIDIKLRMILSLIKILLKILTHGFIALTHRLWVIAQNGPFKSKNLPYDHFPFPSLRSNINSPEFRINSWIFELPLLRIWKWYFLAARWSRFFSTAKGLTTTLFLIISR